MTLAMTLCRSAWIEKICAYSSADKNVWASRISSMMDYTVIPEVLLQTDACERHEFLLHSKEDTAQLAAAFAAVVMVEQQMPDGTPVFNLGMGGHIHAGKSYFSDQFLEAGGNLVRQRNGDNGQFIGRSEIFGTVLRADTFKDDRQYSRVIANMNFPARIALHRLLTHKGVDVIEHAPLSCRRDFHALVYINSLNSIPWSIRQILFEECPEDARYAEIVVPAKLGNKPSFRAFLEKTSTLGYQMPA